MARIMLSTLALAGVATVALAAQPNVTILHGQNNIKAEVPGPGQSSGDVVYLGDFDSTEACEAACLSQKVCHSFTFHTPSFGAPWAKGCYGRTSWTWHPSAQENVDSGRVGTPPCANDYDCRLNGKCVSTKCQCYKGWKGNDCGELDLIPNAKPLSPAYGSPPSDDGSGVASWGASIVRDPDNSSLWHMFVAEMASAAPGGQCGLNAWQRNSVIVHATATSAEGPFQRQKELLGYFAHEPVLLTLPESEGYVIYKIGCADGAVTGSNGTGLVGPCTHCKNGLTMGDCPSVDQSYERVCQDVLHSKSLNGPWERRNLTLKNWDWVRLNLGLESQAPIVFPNGTVLTFTRSWSPPAPLPRSPIWLVRADRWNGTYELANEQWAPAPAFPHEMEDSFMWQDPRGNFHALFHAWDGVGGHGYSSDGLHWTYSPTKAYGSVVSIQDGTTVDYGRRERPRIIFDSEGNPTHLVNGACGLQNAPSQKVGPCQGDWSFTLVQKIRAGKDTDASPTIV